MAVHARTSVVVFALYPARPVQEQWIPGSGFDGTLHRTLRGAKRHVKHVKWIKRDDEWGWDTVHGDIIVAKQVQA